jgi:hypothetical protein
MHRHRKRFALVALVAFLGSLVLMPASVAAAPPASSLSVPITGTATNTLGQTVDFAGTFTPTRFVSQNGQLAVTGTLTGTLTNTVTEAVQQVSRTITLPVGVTQATCDILDLTLGPLDLDLLGLIVHLDQVHLTIDAQQGPGNLLGNLLCAVAGLLDQGGPLQGIVNLLNNLLRSL